MISDKVVVVQDLASIPKYLVTFTVGYNQRNNIDAAVKKVSWSPSSNLGPVLWILFCCFYSFQTTLLSSYFIMMDKQPNGMSLNGPNEQFMWAQGNRRSGEDLLKKFLDFLDLVSPTRLNMLTFESSWNL